MRVTWNGSLSFGLVSIPVGLAPATKPAARQSDISFRLLHRECLTPIKQKRWCPKHDREVGNDELVKGWEVAKGQFVIVEEAELEALERHDDSRTIDIERFVPLAEVTRPHGVWGEVRLKVSNSDSELLLSQTEVLVRRTTKSSDGARSAPCVRAAVKPRRLSR